MNFFCTVLSQCDVVCAETVVIEERRIVTTSKNAQLNKIFRIDANGTPELITPN